MKPATFGWVLGLAATLVLSGCAERRYTAVTSGPGYAAGGPVFVERRPMVIDNQRQVVSIYRTGDAYFYDWGGVRYTFTEYPWGPRRVVPGPSYATIDRGWYRGDAYERGVVRRSARRLVPADQDPVNRAQVGYDFSDDIDHDFVTGERDLRLRF